MTALDTRRPSLGEDARFELAAAAGARERRNRPVWLVGLAAVILGVVLIIAVTGIVSRARAISSLERRLSDQAAVEAMVTKWNALSELERQNPNQAIGEPMENLRSTLEALATRAGFKTPPFTPRETTEPQKAVLVRRYLYHQIKEPSLKVILEWLRLATQDPATRIPGLEVEALTLRPEKDTWSMTLTLRRWERAS
jgi:hypothetical protein